VTEAEVFEFYRRLAENDPDPRTELAWSNPYTLLVAVALSAQATDVSVNKATGPLFARADHPARMIELGEDEVRAHIRTIGLFNTKAKNVILLSQLLLDEHGGEVPAERELLERLPGVGRKTANVVLNVGKTPLAVELGLEAVTPQPFRLSAHHWLILHGRYVCKARRPECWRCIVRDLCAFEPKTPAPKEASDA
jgi:endonuclease-3